MLNSQKNVYTKLTAASSSYFWILFPFFVVYKMADLNWIFDV